MCGFTAIITLTPSAHSDGTPESPASTISANPKTNGYTNGSSPNHCLNGLHLNGYSDSNEAQVRSKVAAQLEAAVEAINHRGPDESNVWVNEDGTVGLGHCRLSINDLSPSGSQPLHSDDGLIHAVVNGEIYDHDRIRDFCISEHGYRFVGHSDSELVLALYKICGAPAMFEHLRGEFSFVLYDSRMERIIACRDRFGIKPIVWTVVGQKLLIASETKAFMGMGWQAEWDVKAIVDAGWMTDDRTLFKGVRKILPGYWMEVTASGGMQHHRYWDADYKNKAEPEVRSIDEMVTGVRERLIESVKIRLRADVPVGIYLSGGIDSSAVAGIVTELARKQHVKIGDKEATRVTCFSVGFPEASGYNEADIADRTANWLGVETIKKDVTEATLADSFQDAVFNCEHHHFDLNFVAKFALSELPREHGVKVVLTGEGADELFAGYPYFPCEYLREPDLAMPGSELAQNDDKRQMMQQAAATEMNAIWRSIGAATYEGSTDSKNLLKDVNGNTMPNNILAWHPSIGLFSSWVRNSYGEQLDCRETLMSSYPPDVREKMREKWHPLHTALYIWNKSQLPNVLLSCLGDRTEMAHSVEGRTPFLDHHLAEYVNSLPPSVKLAYTPTNADQGGEKTESGKDPIWQSAGSSLRSLTSKWILREAARPYILDELYKRKKHPFLAPTKWPRDGPLHRLFKRVLTRESVERLGFVDPVVVEDAFDAAFGEKGEPRSFRILCDVAAWITLADRFNVQPAKPRASI